MTHIASITSFVFAVAGLICVLGWCVRDYRVHKGERIVTGYLHQQNGLPPIKFTHPIKPLPNTVFWVGVVLLYLALIVFSFSPLAPSWS